VTRKTITTIAILVVMLVSLIGTAAAQDVVDTLTPTVTATPLPGAKFFTHPVVKLLSAYFDQEEVTATPTETATETSTETVTDTVTVTETVTETATPTPTDDSGLGPMGELIAKYHEEGMGFGVLVKIFSYVKDSEDACKAQATATPDPNVSDGTPETCTPLTPDELVTMFKEEGMGALFKKYGKPSLLGVGWVRKALKSTETVTTETTEAVTVHGKQGKDTNPGKGNKPEKVKTPSPKGKKP
jgi:hypothetical protein